MKINKLLEIITTYRYGDEYSIECRDSLPLLVIREKDKTHMEELDLPNIESNKTVCIAPRIQEIENKKREREVELSALITKLYSCITTSKLHIILDNTSYAFLLTLLVYSKLKSRIDTDPAVIAKYALSISEFRKVYTKIKELEEKMKYEGVERHYNEYSNLVNKLDSLIPVLNELWSNDKELFDTVNEILSGISVDEEKIRQYIRENWDMLKSNYEELVNKWIDKYKNIIEKYRISYQFILLGESPFIASYNSLVKGIFENMRKVCDHIFVVNGSEALILRELLNLDYEVIVIQ